MKRVMVIEDDPGIQDTISLILESEGYEVVKASNGVEAIRLLENGPEPCLILLDLMMPVMDGWKFRQYQLGQPKLSAIPLAVMSAAGHSDERVKEDFDNAPYLHKPIRLEHLLEVIERHCSSARASLASRSQAAS